MYYWGKLNDDNCQNKKPFMCKKSMDSLEWNILCELPDVGKYLYYINDIFF